MNGLEEKSTMWNLCEGSMANEKVMDMLAEASGEKDLCGVSGMSRSMTDWARMAFKLDGFEKDVKIVIVGKYTGLQDSYLSVIKSLKVSEQNICCVSVDCKQQLTHLSWMSWLPISS